MKKIYIFLSIALFSLNASATTYTVTVSDFAFAPQGFTCQVGDSVKWVWSSGNHNTTSSIVPSGAASWASPINSGATTFAYKVTVAGSYGYSCTFHSNMIAGFQATGTGIQQINLNVATVAYPNPFKDKFTISYAANIDAVTLYNVAGREIRTLDLSPVSDKVEVDLSTLAAGIYFYRTSKEGTVVETRRIIKSN